jgi:hypothetical protein
LPLFDDVGGAAGRATALEKRIVSDEIVQAAWLAGILMTSTQFPA